MSLRAYARRRGVTPMAVSVAVKDGRLRDSVVRDPTGAPKISDPDLADREWAANTDHSKVPHAARERAAVSPGDGDADSVLEASARSKHWDARLKQLKYETAVGQLVSKAEVLREWAGALAVVRVKVLSLPTRLKQEIPALSVEDVVKIEEIVRESLEDLVSDEVEP